MKWTERTGNSSDTMSARSSRPASRTRNGGCAGLVRVEAPPLQVAGDSVTSFNVALVADPALLPSGSHTVSVRIVNLDDPSQVLHEEARLLMP